MKTIVYGFSIWLWKLVYDYTKTIAYDYEDHIVYGYEDDSINDYEDYILLVRIDNDYKILNADADWLKVVLI